MTTAFMVIDVPDLGQEAMVVNTSGPRLLLLDPDVEHERRVEILEYVMATKL